MSIRLPQQVVFSQSLSISSGVNAVNVTLPQDADSFTAVVWCPTLGATSDDVYFQTSYDGGSTWYDMANVQFLATATQANARILRFSNVGAAARTNPVTGSAIGSAPATSTLTNNYTGAPLLGPLMRVYHIVGGSGASVIRTDIIAHHQSATA